MEPKWRLFQMDIAMFENYKIDSIYDHFYVKGIFDDFPRVQVFCTPKSSNTHVSRAKH